MSKLSVTLLTLLSLLFTACGDSSTSSSQLVSSVATRALSEHQFANDENLRVSENNIVILKLESASSVLDANDTHEIGVDAIPYRFTQNQALTLNIDSDENLSIAKIELLDKESQSILAMATKSSSSVNVNIVTNKDYLFKVYHDGGSIENQAIFIRLINQAKTTMFAKSIEESVVPDKKVLVSKDCINCNLSNINLMGYNMSYARLSLNDVEERVCTIIGMYQQNPNIHCDSSGMNIDKPIIPCVSPSQDLQYDLYLDMVGMNDENSVGLIISLEEEFFIEIPDDETPRFINVQDIVEYISWGVSQSDEE